MTVSFRTRLFVTAGFIVTLVLSAVLTVGYKRVLAFEVERLDDRLCIEARRLATQPFPADNLDRLQVDVMSKLRLTQAGQVLLKFEPNLQAEAEMVGFQSPGWQDIQPLDEQNWLPAKSRLPNAEPGCALTSFDTDLRQWRAARFSAAAGRGLLAVDLAATKSELQAAFVQALQIVVPLAALMTALGSWVLSSLTMRPVNRLQQAMANITQKALDARVPAGGEDQEFAALIGAYNAMLARLEKSFQQASRFSSNAAHELKTPLTVLQGHLEQTLSETTQPAQQARLMGLLDEIARLSDITRKLLILSQADAGWLALQHAPIELSTMLDELTVDMQMLLTTQSLNCAVARGLSLNGDAVLLRQLFNNLINNAVRYSLSGGRITLTAKAVGPRIDIEISNTTQTIDAATRARFFERFFRGDAAHNRRVEGSGLGLSLAREIALAHGGSLVLLPSAPDQVVMRLTL